MRILAESIHYRAVVGSCLLDDSPKQLRNIKKMYLYRVVFIINKHLFAQVIDTKQTHGI